MPVVTKTRFRPLLLAATGTYFCQPSKKFRNKVHSRHSGFGVNIDSGINVFWTMQVVSGIWV